MSIKSFGKLRRGFTLLRRRGFTLIELLVTIAIIGMLTGLLVTNIDKSLSQNRIANDAQLFSTKVEEVRLTAASTQSSDEQSVSPTTKQDIGYYGIYLGVDKHSFYLLKLPSDLTGITDSDLSTNTNFVVQKEVLSSGVTVVGGSNHSDEVLAYRVPSQELFCLKRNSTTGKWSATTPIFSSPFFQLAYQKKTASVKIDDYTGKVEVSY
ncbi:MAG TPA: type II secretion system protein [Candidatus Saccharimonadales bacterium]|nr:type II secretion system protein [Candidatus Saccharimonadales bacterium]